MTSTTSALVFSDFPASFKGPTVRCDDPSYAEVKSLWNIRYGQQKPALIARATDADDVRIAVEYAVAKDISIAVRGGGHGIECFAMPDDALVIDLSLLKAISVDPQSGLVTAEAGVLIGELNAATQQHGYAVPAGTVSTVGVSGLTLGGGFGHLTRRFGATLDNLVSVDVVTTDGRALTASADENAELFWGIKGAGQNLVICTRFTFQGKRIGPEVISGFRLYGPDDVLPVLSGLHDAMSAAPRELAISPIVRAAPPIPGVPEHLVGKTIILALVSYTGPSGDFPSAMDAMRHMPKPIMDMVAPSTWLATNTALDYFMPSGRRWYNAGGYLARLSKEVAEIALDCVAVAPPDCEMHFPVMIGALQDYSENSAAFSRAGVSWIYEMTGQWDSAEDDSLYVDWIDASAARLEPHALPNGSITLNQYHGPDGLKKLFGTDEKWNRIVALKNEWDPHNRLSYNKNIRPLVAAGNA